MLSLRRDDVTTTRTVVRITNFNPRLREGGDHPNTAPEATTENFNPRLREGGDDIYHAPSCCKKISIHASAKEATLFIDVIHALHVFQSTPPRRRRRFDPNKKWGGTWISIHASAKEATGYGWSAGDAKNISIHASAKEATAAQLAASQASQFQSTPPRRRRLHLRRIKISMEDFNPRLREGGDI